MNLKSLRRALAAAEGPLSEARTVQAARASAEHALAEAAGAVRDREVLEKLAEIPLESLRGAVPGRVAWSVLLASGIRTVADVQVRGLTDLVAIEGVGPQSARLVKDAAAEVTASLAAGTAPVLRHDSRDPRDADLVTAVVALDDVLRVTRPVESDIDALLGDASAAFDEAAHLRSRMRWLFSSRASRASAAAAAELVGRAIAHHGPAVAEAARGLPGRRERRSAGTSYLEEPARYQALLDSRVGRTRTGPSGLPSELAEAIESCALDVSALRITLRRYQEFGAKFILTQRRVILGDDMGLGKTVQALAALAHASQEHPDFRALVIAPASVLVNWQREITSKSDLQTVTHEVWSASGGVFVTTFERLRELHLDEGDPIHMLVVDEAHYIKNPAAQRTQRVKALLAHAERVVFMTGTPIENRGSEFVELVNMLDATVAVQLVGPAALVSPEEFRIRVAPVYLRRNADEVLHELPELIEVDEWEKMTPHDFEHYRRAVVEGNLMAMRRAAYLAGRMNSSAKLTRLLEITDEAAASGQKVIVYSYFLEVLGIVKDSLRVPWIGPLTGATPPSARQRLIDTFTAAPPGTVLISQISAGGIGLNIQAASVIILCEPQFKPSTENQAIARARRMGQLRAVQVHRLLSLDSIDLRVVEILTEKQGDFNNYARLSDLAAASGDAIDPRVALRLVSDERTRLGIATPAST